MVSKGYFLRNRIHCNSNGCHCRYVWVISYQKTHVLAARYDFTLFKPIFSSENDQLRIPYTREYSVIFTLASHFLLRDRETDTEPDLHILIFELSKSNNLYYGKSYRTQFQLQGSTILRIPHISYQFVCSLYIYRYNFGKFPLLTQPQCASLTVYIWGEGGL